MDIQRMNLCRLTVILAVLAVSLIWTAAGLAIEVPGMITKKSGGTLKGTIKYLPASRKYIVTDPQNSVSVPVPVNEVASIQVADPPDLAPAVRQIQDGQYAQATPTLEKIVKEYEGLGPDSKAARWLAEAHLKTGNPVKAVEMCEKVINENPRGAMGELASTYWDALLGANRLTQLEKALTDAMSLPNRQVVAAALIKRGDLKKKQGNLKEALVDGYLRVVVLFHDIKEAQPEAMYNAIKAFEELRQPAYAEKMRKKLLADFPEDKYSERIKSGS